MSDNLANIDGAPIGGGGVGPGADSADNKLSLQSANGNGIPSMCDEERPRDSVASVTQPFIRECDKLAHFDIIRASSLLSRGLGQQKKRRGRIVPDRLSIVQGSQLGGPSPRPAPPSFHDVPPTVIDIDAEEDGDSVVAPPLAIKVHHCWSERYHFTQQWRRLHKLTSGLLAERDSDALAMRRVAQKRNRERSDGGGNGQWDGWQGIFRHHPAVDCSPCDPGSDTDEGSSCDEGGSHQAPAALVRLAACCVGAARSEELSIPPALGDILLEPFTVRGEGSSAVPMSVLLWRPSLTDRVLVDERTRLRRQSQEDFACAATQRLVPTHKGANPDENCRCKEVLARAHIHHVSSQRVPDALWGASVAHEGGSVAHLPTIAPLVPPHGSSTGTAARGAILKGLMGLEQRLKPEAGAASVPTTNATPFRKALSAAFGKSFAVPFTAAPQPGTPVVHGPNMLLGALSSHGKVRANASGKRGAGKALSDTVGSVHDVARVSRGDDWAGQMVDVPVSAILTAAKGMADELQS